jgi:hypothetical protein
MLWLKLTIEVGLREDLGAEINAALFTLNGRTGYVLKPEVLRVKGQEKDKETLAKTTKYVLDITVSFLLTATTD